MTGKVLCIVFLLLAAGLLVATNGSGSPAATSAEGSTAVTSTVKTHTPLTEQVVTATGSLVQTLPPEVSPTANSSLESDTDIPTPIAPTATWTWQPPGAVRMPILLYHHVSQGQSSRYSVSTENFEAQIAHLNRAGYTAIPISRLVEALSRGAQLPAKPVVITFDDGYRDVYERAFPVMQRYGFVGTVFIITDQLGVKGYMDTEMLRALAYSGWEIGSHSQSHPNLRLSGVKLVSEIEESRRQLEDQLHVPVVTFSYPYGLTSQYIRRLVEQAGYRAAVGLGENRQHSQKSMYYLSRIEIPKDADLVKFAQLVAGRSSGSLPAPEDFPPGP